MIFADRVDAGRRLAAELKGVCPGDGVVLAVPRGGVVVGAEVARELGFPLDVVIPRKIGAPQNPELAIGAVTQDGTVYLNRPLMAALGIGEEEVFALVKEEEAEIERRMRLYRGSTEYPAYDGRCVIVVDDGIATGYTITAALRWVRKKFSPCKLILAVPVAPRETAVRLKGEVDQLVVLSSPADFYAVGQFYRDFSQTSDRDVIDLLEENKKALRRSK
ncbi:phosphoribosyltransferase [Desulfovirgula thermocuniculi]|uniref:phosphoribosyltransferase n=1 Tax=Desulfovirgula thermocuniculi TaxID=348842 RepID=UPI00041F3DBF|nr:phosphoribosyltransferase [Desulfovirgula thermocuniculi]